MILGAVLYGWTLSGLLGKFHWYQGNWTIIGEFFGGVQYHPDASFVVGLTPLMRYTIATEARWLPFVEGGFGPAFTDIGTPDLGSRAEFNIQAGVGTHYFFSEHQAITMQWRYLHISNAGIEKPNKPNIGVNSSFLMIGTTWFFLG